MKTSIIYSLTENFDSCAHKTSDGVEFWMARDSQHLLSYTKWDNFQGVISKAKTACELSPAYDVCYAYDPNNIWVNQHTLSINGKHKDIQKSDLLKIAPDNIKKAEK